MSGVKTAFTMKTVNVNSCTGPLLTVTTSSMSANANIALESLKISNSKMG